MIYLYGLVQPAAGTAVTLAPGETPGVTGPVSARVCGGLVLIHGDHDGSEILPRRRALLTHARVLERAMGAGTVLPMRFGMTCPSPAAFEEIVKRNRDGIAAALDRLAGRVEVGVRISGEEPRVLEATLSASPALASARDRLQGRSSAGHFAKVEFGRSLGEAVAARRKAAQKVLLDRLAPHAADHVLKAPETDFEALRAEYLVDENRLAAFTSELDRAARELDFAGDTPCTARLVGPGPAFHFIRLNLAPAGAEAVA